MQNQKELISTNKAKVIISKNLAAQIQYLHHRCPKGDEWSGLLIWQLIKGSLEDLTEVEIKAEAVFVMDFGTATFTSFEGNEDWIKCFQQYPQIDPINPQPGWYCSKIHSHNSMSVFHSGTDKGDLYENAPKLPMFLSLIVNYACELDCELAIAMEVEETLLSRVKWKLKGWKNKEKKVEKTTNNKNMIFLLKCDVEYEQDQWMKDQCDYLKSKPKATTGYTYEPYKGAYTSGNYNGSSYNSNKKEDKDEKLVVRKFVNNKVIDELPDLITLGKGSSLSMVEAIDKTNDAVGINEREKYKKALKVYFANYWYDTTFYNLSTNYKEVIQAILNLTSLQNGWITTVIKEAINELKDEYPKLWEVQESSLV